ncbi:zinc-finger domain-containing protein [Schinkia azotoformans]|uniref:zinc-finger domain-containing protein n=1 Tax=Schinkia azotoformans TaxID=1454 RepID=UPI002DB8F28A|nr:zinc-finger domain-containing protein [Schinkia azotoformans]MEC1744150.1 zinc-finger domain-containing protein [Schinkia azotoformans]
MSICGQVVDKKEAKKIRNKISRLLDSKCTGCSTRANNYKLKGQYEAYKYCNESCFIGKNLQELSKKIGNERDPIWTDDEVNYLLNHYQLYSIEHLSKRLERSPEAVEIKLKRLLDPRKKRKRVDAV